MSSRFNGFDYSFFSYFCSHELDFELCRITEEHFVIMTYDL